MTDQPINPQAGSLVILMGLPTGFLDDLPPEDQKAIREMVGKPIQLNEYDEYGRAELEFTETDGTIHFIYVDPAFLKAAS